MIEVVSADRCVTCDVCIKVCPTDVFDRGPDGLPVIARQSDCQTCFMCEAHCPTDALYVAPFTKPAPEGSTHTNETALTNAFGAYRDIIGWGRGRTPGSRIDANHIFTNLIRTRPAPATDREQPSSTPSG